MPERKVGADRHDLLVALFAGPLPQRMHRLRTRPAGSDHVRILGQVALRQVIRGCHRGNENRLVLRADRPQRIACRSELRAGDHVHLVLQGQLFGFGHRRVGLALLVLDDQLDLRPGEVAVDLVEIHLEAVDHVLADLGEDTGDRRDKADAQFFLLRAGGGRAKR